MIINFAAVAAWAADVVEGSGAAQGGQQSSPYMSFVMLAGVFAVLYFLMIRPQQKRQKEHQAMLQAMQKGDKVQTSGGLFGTITGLDQADITLEIAPQVRVKVGRAFIARIIRPGDNNPSAAK
ncbi:MAG: preprotein translocase subunit YajC [Candidatus Adiutrix sp.]|jgi:preprotein translocase subunit YajC|nr:preprotein translocase subunit YajC [Candidatus Adiutrix sp.]